MIEEPEQARLDLLGERQLDGRGGLVDDAAGGRHGAHEHRVGLRSRGERERERHQKAQRTPHASSRPSPR